MELETDHMALTPELQDLLLTWYAGEARDLPWRRKGDLHPEPYHVWLSEIMLQQTTVATVLTYFEAFLKRWPTVEALAHASLDDVLHAWQGLGYYTRARNLHRCARVIVTDHEGRFPKAAEDLEKLPGIGPYTARAIAAIAFGKEVIPVDGNVVRVMARLFGNQTKPPRLIEDVRKLTGAVQNLKAPYDLVQALMDLGATLCTPQKPACERCPWNTLCVARQKGLTKSLPAKKETSEKPIRKTIAWVIQNPEGRLLLRKRSDKGLLAGLWEVPSTDWALKTPSSQKGRLEGTLRHTFSHFHLDVEVRTLTNEEAREDGLWFPPESLKELALPTLTKKILKKAGFISYELL